jgi:hypothetical protein
MRKILLLLCLTGCALFKPQEVKPIEPSLNERFTTKHENYLAWSITRNSSGNTWIKDTKCDGLLFTALWAVAGGTADIELGEGEAGRWYRSPEHDCYPTQSGSSISRDMFVGLLIWVWDNKRLDILERLIAYGKANKNKWGIWMMGDGPESRVGIRPNLQATIFMMTHAMGGEDNKLRHVPQAWSTDLKGYPVHLQALHMYLRAKVRGKMTLVDLNILIGYLNKHPNNAMLSALVHKYTDGDFTHAIKILMNTQLFPDDRLPSSKDRCTDYLWQRDELKEKVLYPQGKDRCIEYQGRLGKPHKECNLVEDQVKRMVFSHDWKKCDRDHIFSAVDFLFAASIIKG